MNIDKIEKQISERLKLGVDKALIVLKQNIDSLTPEDTKTLLSNNKVNEAIVSGETVKGSISNDTEYAVYVEYGVGGKTYNYHKPKGSIFYQGVGARMFTRGMDNSKKTITDIINNALKGL